MANPATCRPQAVREKPDLSVKSSIITCLFNKSLPNARAAQDWNDFFGFYHDEIKYIGCGDHSPSVTRFVESNVSTHNVVRDLMKGLLNENVTCTREQLKAKVRALLPNAAWRSCTNSSDDERECSEDHILDAILRIILMTNVNKPVRTGTEVVWWQLTDTRTLEHFLAETFPKSTCPNKERTGRLHPFFEADFMRRICGLRFRATNSLEDHLRLVPDGKKWILKVFMHKRWLVEQIERQRATQQPPVLGHPVELLKETLQTLDLLFPYNDEKSRKLWVSMGASQIAHRLGAGKRKLGLADYCYWRDRLVELNEDVFQAPATDWRQLFLDKRVPERYWAFWIAIVILILTVVSTVATTLQTIYTMLAFYKGS